MSWKEKKISKRKFGLTPYLFLAAPLSFFSVFIIGPALYSVCLSFIKWDIISPMEFIGFRNYKFLFSDPVFYRCLINNAKWLLIYLAIPIVVGLCLALALSKVKKGASVLKAGFYLPITISLVAVSLMWIWIYNPELGLLNNVLRKLGLGFMARTWLGDPSTALYSVIAAGFWVHLPLVTIIFLVGLTNVPPAVIEAARIDGANSMQLTRYITIPFLAPAFVIAFCITVVASLRSFDVVYVMTQGGPANSSNVLSVFMFHEAFHDYRLGYGSSIAVILTLLTFVFIIVYLNRVIKRQVRY